MKRGSVIVDISIDQGGFSETSRPTTHADPSYVEHGVVHYCVTNMPGAVARTSTFALNNATLPFVLALADKGVLAALRADPHLRAGLNVLRGADHVRGRRRGAGRRLRRCNGDRLSALSAELWRGMKKAGHRRCPAARLEGKSLNCLAKERSLPNLVPGISCVGGSYLQ